MPSADLTVESRDVPHDTIVDECIDALRAWLCGDRQPQPNDTRSASRHDRAAEAVRSRSPSTSRSAIAPMTSSSAATCWRSLGARDRRAAARRAHRHRHRPHGRQASGWSRPRPALARGRHCRRRAIVVAGGRGLENLCRLREGLRGADRGEDRAQRSRDRARRRRGRRSRRLCGGDPAPRRRFRADADLAAGAGRFLGRRQDRHQLAAGQEPGRRVSPADAGDRRHRGARHAVAARVPRRLCRGRQIRRCSATPPSSPGSKPTGADVFAGGAGARARDRHLLPRQGRDRRARRAREPASARCSISATPSATRWRPRPASPTGCSTARASPSAWCWRSNFPRELGMMPGSMPTRVERSSCRRRPADPFAGHRRIRPGRAADADALMALMAQDKKVKRGELTFILLRGGRPRRDRQRRRAGAGARISAPKTAREN